MFELFVIYLRYQHQCKELFMPSLTHKKPGARPKDPEGLNTTLMQVRMPEWLHKEIVMKAQARNISISEYLRQLLLVVA